MSADQEEIMTVPVRLHPDDLAMIVKGKPDRQRSVSTTFTTYTSSANDGVGAQRILPPSRKRISAMIIPHGAIGGGNPNTSYGWLAKTASDAAKQTGAFIEGVGQGPIPVLGHEAVFFAADPGSTTASVITVVANYYED